MQRADGVPAPVNPERETPGEDRSLLVTAIKKPEPLGQVGVDVEEIVHEVAADRLLAGFQLRRREDLPVQLERQRRESLPDRLEFLLRRTFRLGRFQDRLLQVGSIPVPLIAELMS